MSRSTRAPRNGARGIATSARMSLRAPPLSPAGAIQLNDVFVDENRIVYTIDRFGGGLYVLEMNI